MAPCRPGAAARRRDEALAIGGDSGAERPYHRRCGAVNKCGVESVKGSQEKSCQLMHPSQSLMWRGVCERLAGKLAGPSIMSAYASGIAN